MQLWRFLILFELLYFMLLVLNDRFEIVYATVSSLLFTDESVSTFCALYFNFWTFFFQMLFNLRLCHFLGALTSACCTLLRTWIDAVARTLVFQVVDEVTVLEHSSFIFILWSWLPRAFFLCLVALKLDLILLRLPLLNSTSFLWNLLVLHYLLFCVFKAHRHLLQYFRRTRARRMDFVLDCTINGDRL